MTDGGILPEVSGQKALQLAKLIAANITPDGVHDLLFAKEAIELLATKSRWLTEQISQSGALSSSSLSSSSLSSLVLPIPSSSASTASTTSSTTTRNLVTSVMIQRSFARWARQQTKLDFFAAMERAEEAETIRQP